MCDYSISAASQRAAKVGDRLFSCQFGVSRGFRAEGSEFGEATCLLPGTELAFDEAIDGHKVARFRQVDTDNLYCHHDAFELPDGKIIMVNSLALGTRATVLQLPAAPKTDTEAKAQERVAQVA